MIEIILYVLSKYFTLQALHIVFGKFYSVQVKFNHILKSFIQYSI